MQNFNIGGFEEMILFRLKFPDWGVSTLRVIQIHTIQIEGYLVQPIGVPDFLNLDVVTETKSRILSINYYTRAKKKQPKTFKNVTLYFYASHRTCLFRFPHLFIGACDMGWYLFWRLHPFLYKSGRQKIQKVSGFHARIPCLRDAIHFQWTFA